MLPFEPEWQDDQDDYCSCECCEFVELVSFTIGIETYAVGEIKIGKHRFQYHGTVEGVEAWRRHMERCKRDYEVRLAMRTPNPPI